MSEFEELIDDLIDIQDTITHAVEHGEVNQRDKDKRAQLKQAIIREMQDIKSRAEAAEERLQDYQDGIAKVLSETCPTDEKHCGCVPILRTRIAGLESELAVLKEAVRYHPANEFPEDNGVYIDCGAPGKAYLPFVYRWTVAFDPRIMCLSNIPQPPEEGTA